MPHADALSIVVSCAVVTNHTADVVMSAAIVVSGAADVEPVQRKLISEVFELKGSVSHGLIFGPVDRNCCKEFWPEGPKGFCGSSDPQRPSLGPWTLGPVSVVPTCYPSL